MSTYLATVLNDILPLLLGHARLLLQALDIPEFALIAESEDQEIIQIQCLRGPLSLNNACASPGRLTDEVGILLFL